VEFGAGTRQEINSPAGASPGSVTTEWQMLAAETIAGVNQILWRNNTAKYLHVWNLDANWNWQSSRGVIDPLSSGGIALIADFGLS
jgi:hypothetical protein